ncbi:MAG: outer membrane receptor for ferrienterochelin and colicins, partial [Gammaproteobacteria bacterium]
MCFFYSFRNMAIFVITINMSGAFETRAGQPETAAKLGVNVTQQSAESDQSHHQDGHGDDEKHHEHDEGVESILVLSTRLGRSVNDEPIRVEVIVRE